jgi:hypothetical protein
MRWIAMVGVSRFWSPWSCLLLLSLGLPLVSQAPGLGRLLVHWSAPEGIVHCCWARPRQPACEADSYD